MSLSLSRFELFNTEETQIVHFTWLFARYLSLSAAFSVPDVLGDDSLHLLSQHGILSQL